MSTVPPSVILTPVELLGLLALSGGATAARERLGLGPVDPDAERAGQVSLRERGLVVPGSTGLTPSGPGAVIAAVLAAADARWIRIVHGAPTGMSGSLLIDSAAASLGVTPRADRTFTITALPPGYSADSVLGAAVLPYLDARTPGIVEVAVLQPDRESVLTLSRDPQGSWWQHDDAAEPLPTTRSAAAVALAGLTAA